MRILVVEDNADLREYLRVALQAQEYEVLSCPGEQQRRKLDAERWAS